MKVYIRASIIRRKYYRIKDLDCEIIVEECTRKSILDNLDEYLDVLKTAEEHPNWYTGEDEAFHILYNDGSEDSISNYFYDGHHIKRTNIASIVYNNPSTSCVYGNYSINDSGVVSPSFDMDIDDNIELVRVE